MGAVQAFRKPYPGAPNVTSLGGSAGFNLSSSGQATQAKIPQFFTMGTSTSLGLSPSNINVQRGHNSAPNTNPEPKDKSGWYWSEFGGGWYKTGKLLDKERREATRAEELDGEASQPTSSSTTISEAQAAEIRVQVHQAIQEGLPRLAHKWEESQKSRTCTRTLFPLVQNLAWQTQPLISLTW